MKLKKLFTKNFRNLKEDVLEFHPDLNFFIGPNAQGKTNLLEAIYLLSTGSSHRSTTDREMINWQKDFFYLKGRVEDRNGVLDISINYQPGKKEICIDGTPLKKISDLLGYLNVVIFTPDDLQLVKGSPSIRRDFINNEISQVDPVYNHYLNKYRRVLKHRNNLLKKTGSKKKIAEELLAWDLQLTELGSRIIRKRMEVVNKLNPLARLMQRKITLGKEELILSYQCDLGVDYQAGPGEIQKKFLSRLEKEREEEIRRGITLSGPHRDDLRIESNHIDMRKYGSQGQQRTCVLALKLAELEFMKSERGEYPLLLLDDVFSELDAVRREHLIEVIKDRVQTFITGTESNIINYFPQNSKVFAVSSGKIEGKEKGREGQEGL